MKFDNDQKDLYVSIARKSKSFTNTENLSVAVTKSNY